MSFLDLLPGNEGFKRRRRADAVAANAAILNMTRGGPAPLAPPVIKAVELAMRARCPDMADNDDVVRLISAFVDASPRWTLVQAAGAGLWPLVQRIALRDRFDAVDPSYRQWVYTKAMASAAGAGRLDMVQFLTAYFPGCYVTLAVEEAAGHGQMAILQWFREHHSDVKWGGDELSVALRNNHFEVARWLYANVHLSRLRGNLKLSAVDSGNLAMVQWAFDNEDPSNPPYLFQNAVNMGNLELVKWMIESGNMAPDDTGDIWLDVAASEGFLDVIQWLTSRGIGRCSERCVEQAGANGHLEVVKWVIEHRNDGHGEDPMDEIAGHGRLGVLRWLVGNHVECFSSSAMDMAARNGHLDVVIYLHKNEAYNFGCSYSAMNGAAENGRLDIVQWLHEHRDEGCTSTAMDGAAMNGHLDVIKWLHTNRTEGCTTWAMNFAAMNGHLHVVKWLHANRNEGCTIDAMSRAAGNGHLDVVRWLHENRSEGLTSHSIVSASRGGHLDVLRYLHQHRRLEPSEEALVNAADMAAGNGFLATVRWLAATYNAHCSTTATDIAARNGLFDMVIVLRSEFGCECSEDMFASMIKTDELEILQWLCRHFPDQVDRSCLLYESFGHSPYIRHWLYLESGLYPAPRRG